MSLADSINERNSFATVANSIDSLLYINEKSSIIPKVQIYETD
jgi:hypothetical protein